MTLRRILRVVWILAGLALVLAWSRDDVLDLKPSPRALPRFDGGTGLPWITGSFVPQTLEQGMLPPSLEHASSWVYSDDWQGRAETAWFKTSRRSIYVAVAGYPRHPGCSLWAEFRDPAGAVTKVACSIADPGEQWSLWQLRRPARATAVRIIGVDTATGVSGWLSFSHPFRAWPPALAAGYQFCQLVTTLALALTLIWGPGLLWCPRNASPVTRLLYFLGAGPLVLVLLGVAIWCAGGFVSPHLVGTTAVAAWLAVIGVRAYRRGFDVEISPCFARVLGVTALVIAAVVARSACSLGPEGELFRGTVSRNMELSDRIDSRFSFYVVQAAILKYSPASPETEKYFYPWTFFSRGPLAGLAAIPMVTATAGQPPIDPPELRFLPFDPYGFTAYRITAIVLAGSVVIALFLMLAALVGEAWALAGAGLLALSPFGVHEIMFTWPKWAATAWTIASFALAHARRPGAAGLALGIGFLFHPLALLWSLWIGLWAAGRATQTSAPHSSSDSDNSKPKTQNSKLRALRAARALARCAGGAAVLVLPWMLLGAVMPHLPDTPFAGQSGFLRYWVHADWEPATWNSWWRTRWMNFANTFVPLHLWLHEPSFHHHKLGSAYELSGSLSKFTQLWWNSFPFALGLGLWSASLVVFRRAWRTLRAATWLFLILPALCIVAYWGMDPLGLMRECGHPLFVATIGIATVVAARDRGWLGCLFAQRAVPWLQLPETFLMLWLATLLNQRQWPADYTDFDALYLALNVIALLAAAAVLARARLRLPATAAAGPALTAPPALHPARMLAPARTHRIEWIVFVFAAAAPFISSVQFERIVARVLHSPSYGGTSMPAGAFQPGAVYPTTDAAAIPSGVDTLGSWIESDAFQGAYETQWLRARGTVTLMIAGYPALAPNQLELDLRRFDGTQTTVRYTGPDPGEAWQPWRVTLPKNATALRIRAVDGSAAAYGWLGFSEPFTDVSFLWRQLWPLVQLAAVTSLALVLLQGPGLLHLRQNAGRPRDFIPALALGPLLVGLLGLACWLLGGWVAPAVTARVGIAALLIGIGRNAWRARHLGPALPAGAAPVLLATALLVGFAVAKANLSTGPAGELFGGTVSRTLAVGGHSDSRTSYHIVQLIANHAGPFSKQAESHFSPWSIANRGPLGGLIAAPIVLATGGQPAPDAVHQPWQPFDRQGFAAYRISQIALASLAAWAVFAAVAAILPAPWPLFAAVVVLLTPFFVHELYFTWPKLATAAFVLAAFVCAHERRPFVAALMLAISYLFHPLALFSAPFLALWLLTRHWHEPVRWRRFLAPALFCLTLLPVVGGWMLLGRLAPLRNGAQTVFFDFFRLASGTLPVDAAAWWQSRWSNFANTFLPLHLLRVDPAHESINSVYGLSDAWVQTSFLYWNTLPFALGVPAFLLLAGGVAAACRRAFLVALVAFVAPTLLLIFYWGAASTGMMRHCGHVLFVTTIVFGVWGLGTHAGPWRVRAAAAFVHPVCLAWRGFEIALVAFGTTLLNRQPDLAAAFGWNDILSLLFAFSCLGAVLILLAKTARRLCDFQSNPASCRRDEPPHSRTA